jgi:fucose 4-O-acetylase-like acetyltransferase
MDSHATNRPHWISKAFNLEQLRKSRLHWVDYLKGIAILLVVYRHVLIGIERSGIGIPDTLVTANMIFYSFRMPLFFILSGIFISLSLAKRKTGELILIKFDNLLYPYLVWSFLQITLQIVFSGSTNSDRSLVDYTYIFYQPRNLDQFWYLPALFNTSVIYLLVKSKLHFRPSMQLAMGLILYFLSPYFQKISMISDWMEFYLFFALGDAISVFFFSKQVQDFLKKPLLLLLMMPVFAIVQIYYLRNDEYYYINDMFGKVQFLGIALIGCFTMLLIAFRFQEWKTLNFLRVLGFHSLQIYVMHVFVAAFSRILLIKIAGITDPVILLICGIALGVTIPVIFYNLLIRNNILWFLFTFRRKEEASTKYEVRGTNANRLIN